MTMEQMVVLRSLLTADDARRCAIYFDRFRPDVVRPRAVDSIDDSDEEEFADQELKKLNELIALREAHKLDQGRLALNVCYGDDNILRGRDVCGNDETSRYHECLDGDGLLRFEAQTKCDCITAEECGVNCDQLHGCSWISFRDCIRKEGPYSVNEIERFVRSGLAHGELPTSMARELKRYGYPENESSFLNFHVLQEKLDGLTLRQKDVAARADELARRAKRRATQRVQDKTRTRKLNSARVEKGREAEAQMFRRERDHVEETLSSVSNAMNNVSAAVTSTAGEVNKKLEDLDVKKLMTCVTDVGDLAKRGNASIKRAKHAFQEKGKNMASTLTLFAMKWAACPFHWSSMLFDLILLADNMFGIATLGVRTLSSFLADHASTLYSKLETIISSKQDRRGEDSDFELQGQDAAVMVDPITSVCSMLGTAIFGLATTAGVMTSGSFRKLLDSAGNVGRNVSNVERGAESIYKNVTKMFEDLRYRFITWRKGELLSGIQLELNKAAAKTGSYSYGVTEGEIIDVAKWFEDVSYCLCGDHTVEISSASWVAKHKKLLDISRILQTATLHGDLDTKLIGRSGLLLINATVNQYRKLVSDSRWVTDGAHERDTPWVCWLEGKTGVGKTAIMEQLMRDVANPANTTIKWNLDNLCWGWNPNLKHADNYNQQEFVSLDDGFCEESAPGVADSTESSFIRMASKAVYPVPQASIEKKGMFFTSRAIWITSNQLHPKPKGINNHDAFQGRRVVLAQVTRLKKSKEFHYFDDLRFQLYEKISSTGIPVKIGELMTYNQFVSLCIGSLERWEALKGSFVNKTEFKMDPKFKAFGAEQVGTFAAEEEEPTVEGESEAQTGNPFPDNDEVEYVSEDEEEDDVELVAEESDQLSRLTRDRIGFYYRATKDAVCEGAGACKRAMCNLCTAGLSTSSIERNSDGTFKCWRETKKNWQYCVKIVKGFLVAIAMVLAGAAIWGIWIGIKTVSQALKSPSGAFSSVMEKLHLREKPGEAQAGAGPSGDARTYKYLADQTRLKLGKAAAFSAQSGDGNSDEVATIVEKQLCHLVMNDRRGNGVFLRSNVILTNAHYFGLDIDKDQQEQEFEVEVEEAYTRNRRKVVVRKSGIVFLKDEENPKCSRDICVFEVRGFRPMKDLIPHIQSEIEVLNELRSGVLVGLNVQEDRIEEPVRVQVPGVKLIKANWAVVVEKGPRFVVAKHYAMQLQTAKGDCGAILMADDPKRKGKVIGMHFAGHKKGVALSEVLVQEELEPMVDSLGVVYPKLLDDVEGLCETEEGEPTVTFEAECGVRTLGVVKNLRPGIVGKSQIVPLPTAGKIFLAKTSPAALTINNDLVNPEIRAKGRQVMSLSMDKFGNKIPTYNPVAIKMATDAIDIVMSTWGAGLNLKRELTEEEMLNGVEGTRFERLDLSKSAGIPWKDYATPSKPGKKAYFNVVNADQCVEKQRYWFSGTERRIKEGKLSLQQEIHKTLEELYRLEITPYLFGETLKDERRSLQKVYDANTRTFDIAPLHILCIGRKLFGGWMAAAGMDPVNGEISVGIDMLGPDATALRERLNKFNGKCIAGDRKQFDGNCCEEIQLAGLGCVNRWYKDPEGAKARLTWLVSTIHSTHLACNSLVAVSTGVKSGLPTTSPLNSLFNWIELLAAIWEICAENGLYLTVQELIDEVEIALYGDDHWIATSVRIQEHVTFYSVQAWFARRGLGYTDASKDSAKEKEFMEIDEVVYLKRKMRQLEGTLFYTAPLELQSIHELLNWRRESREMTDDEVFKVNIDNFHRELFHHGASVYRKHLVHVNDCLGDFRDEWAQKGNDVGVYADQPDRYLELRATFLAQFGVQG